MLPFFFAHPPDDTMQVSFFAMASIMEDSKVSFFVVIDLVFFNIYFKVLLYGTGLFYVQFVVLFGTFCYLLESTGSCELSIQG